MQFLLTCSCGYEEERCELDVEDGKIEGLGEHVINDEKCFDWTGNATICAGECFTIRIINEGEL